MWDETQLGSHHTVPVEDIRITDETELTDSVKRVFWFLGVINLSAFFPVQEKDS